MDWKTFIVEMTKALAWPVAVISVVFYFKGELSKLLPRLKKLKHKDTEFEFAEGVVELIREAETTGEKVTPPKPGDVLASYYDELMRLAEISPRAAVMEAFRTIEISAMRILPKAYPGIVIEGVLPPMEVFKRLRERNVLDEYTHRSLIELRKLRNKAVHAEEFSLHGRPIEGYVAMSLAIARLIDDYKP